MKKAVMVIAHQTFRDEELFVPREILAKNGVSVTVASTDLSYATGKLGGRAKPDILLGDAAAKDFDAVIFIGGAGAACYFDDPAAHQLAREALALGKTVAAICCAPVILARAGILKGKKATCFPSDSQDLVSLGVTFTGKPVEKDGRIITANGPDAAKAFGEALVLALENS